MPPQITALRKSFTAELAGKWSGAGVFSEVVAEIA
jgi:hypothetical protein